VLSVGVHRVNRFYPVLPQRPEPLGIASLPGRVRYTNMGIQHMSPRNTYQLAGYRRLNLMETVVPCVCGEQFIYIYEVCGEINGQDPFLAFSACILAKKREPLCILYELSLKTRKCAQRCWHRRRRRELLLLSLLSIVLIWFMSTRTRHSREKVRHCCKLRVELCMLK
jgi:hypothetical protein